MKFILLLIALALSIGTNQACGAELGYNFAVTTAYSFGDPFQNEIDSNFIEPDTGFFRVANSGASTFSGVIGTIAVSSFAGDLSWQSNPLVLAPGASVSVGIPDDSSAVGGFNGPYYFYRPGVEITLQGVVSDAFGTEPVNLLVADRDIHSGIVQTDPFGLSSDSFVLQGGDPWGFNNGDAYALSQPFGMYVFSQPIPEPGTSPLLLSWLMLGACHVMTSRRLVRRPCDIAYSRSPEGRNGPRRESAWETISYIASKSQPDCGAL